MLVQQIPCDKGHAGRQAQALHTCKHSPRSASRIRLQATTQTLSSPPALQEVATEVVRGERRVAYRKDGWQRWTFDGRHKINYIATGSEGPIVILIHGFGASAYHYRYNIPVLAQNHRVFSLCLLGFGWSDKPLVSYGDYAVWIKQLQDFIREVVQPNGEKVVLAGNSLGGYVALATAAANPAAVKGVVLLNAAGRFQDVKEVVVKEVETAVGSAPVAQPVAAGVRQAGEATSQPQSDSGSSSGQKTSSKESGMSAAARVSLTAGSADDEESLLAKLTSPFRTIAQRGAVFLAFLAAKQPSRIRQVLKQVYHDESNLDEDLVSSISEPAKDPNAAEVFYRIITGRGEPVNVLLDRLQGTPLLLLWGRYDPWIRPATAERIASLYPAAQISFVEGGHCPQDDVPRATNEALEAWVAEL